MRLTHIMPILLGLLATLILLGGPQAQNAPDEDFSRWPELVNPFESTSGGGVMIDRYAPVVVGKTCRTDFTVTLPNAGGTFLNEVTFDAIPTQGGILCSNGRWRAKDGSAEGTTPFRVFLKDGMAFRPPS